MSVYQLFFFFLVKSEFASRTPCRYRNRPLRQIVDVMMTICVKRSNFGQVSRIITAVVAREGLVLEREDIGALLLPILILCRSSALVRSLFWTPSPSPSC